jgi:biotin transport system substrate-specific component
MTLASPALPLVPALLPRDRATRLIVEIGLVLTSTLLIALSSKVKVPLGPVDMSLQTLAILTLAGLLGLRLAGATMVAYLAEGMAGLPVFQGTPEKGIGLAYMVGPTGGYLAGFLVMALIVGWAVDRGWGREPVKLVGAMLAAEAVMLAMGYAWLAVLFGAERAFSFGVGPFILTDLVKVALAAALIIAASGLGRKAA